MSDEVNNADLYFFLKRSIEKEELTFPYSDVFGRTL